MYRVATGEHFNMDFPPFADGLSLGPPVFSDGTVTARIIKKDLLD